VKTLKEFSVAGLIVGTIAHVTLSLMVGLLYAALVPMLPRRREWLYGESSRRFLWTLAIYVSLRLINPMLESAIIGPGSLSARSYLAWSAASLCIAPAR